MDTQKYIFHHYPLYSEAFQLRHYGCGRTEDDSIVVIDVPRLLGWKRDQLKLPRSFGPTQKSYLDAAIQMIKDGEPCACGWETCKSSSITKMIEEFFEESAPVVKEPEL